MTIVVPPPLPVTPRLAPVMTLSEALGENPGESELAGGLNWVQGEASPFPPDGDPDHAWTLDLAALKGAGLPTQVELPAFLPPVEGQRASAGIGVTVF